MKRIYCYSKDGMSMRLVDESYRPALGEKISEGLASPTQLSAMFPGYTAAFHKKETMNKIRDLENQVTPRMMQEAMSGSENRFASGDFKGMTAMEAIRQIRQQIDTLRATIK